MDNRVVWLAVLLVFAFIIYFIPVGYVESSPGTGTSCLYGGECTSTYCVDGTCCATPCAGTCDNCASPTPGTCTPIDSSCSGNAASCACNVGNANAYSCSTCSTANYYCFNYVCTDTTNYKKLLIQDSTGTTKAFYDDHGNLAVTSAQVGDCSTISPTGNAYSYYSNAGVRKTWIDQTGAACLSGSVTTGVSSASLPASCPSNSLFIQNSAGTNVMCFNSGNGNLYLVGYYTFI